MTTPSFASSLTAASVLLGTVAAIPQAKAQNFVREFSISLSNISANGTAANRTGKLTIYTGVPGSGNPYEVKIDSQSPVTAGSFSYVSNKKLTTSQNLTLGSVTITTVTNRQSPYYGQYLMSIQHNSGTAGGAWDSIFNGNFFMVNPLSQVTDALGIRQVTSGTILFVMPKDLSKISLGEVNVTGKRQAYNTTYTYSARFTGTKSR